MKKILTKFSILVLLVTVLSSLSILSYAASDYSITSGISTIDEGKSYTIQITAKGLTGRFNISSSSNVSVNCDSIWVENGVADTTVKVTAKSKGKATVTFSPESVAKASTGELVNLSSKTDTVTVQAKTSSNAGDNTPKPTTKKLSFDSVDETVYATSEVNVRANYSTSSSRLGGLEKGDSVRRTGIATEYLDGILWSKVSYNGQTAYISSDFLSRTKPAKPVEKPDDDKDDDKEDEKKSSNNNLKSLKITQLGLTPTFDPNIQEYTLTIGANIDSLNIDAVPADEKAKVTISGNKDLQIGENTIIIKVTAEDGKEQEYEIVVTKEEEIQLGLKELLVEGLPLTPEFSQTVYEYTLKLEKSDITELNITATASRKNASIEIIGNSDLKPGENVITILVKPENEEEEVITYQLTVNIPKKEEKASGLSINSDEMKKYMIIGGGVLLVIIIVIIIIVKRRKNEREEEDYFKVEETSEENEKKSEEIDINSEMEKLSEEELPKSMRKPKEDVTEPIDEVKSEEDSDKKRKIDEFLSGKIEQEEPSTRRKKGKHF